MCNQTLSRQYQDTYQQQYQKHFKEQKVVIILVGQEYKFTEGQYDYKTGTGTIYREQELPMDIGKSKENFKDGKSRYFNCNIYGYIAKDCIRLKKERDNRKCYKCEQVGHIAKDCRIKQKMKNQSVQDDTEIEEEDKEKDFGNSPEQTQYKEPL